MAPEVKGPDCFYHFWDMVAIVYPVETLIPPSENDENEVPIAGNGQNNGRLSLENVYVEDF